MAGMWTHRVVSPASPHDDPRADNGFAPRGRVLRPGAEGRERPVVAHDPADAGQAGVGRPATPPDDASRSSPPSQGDPPPPAAIERQRAEVVRRARDQRVGKVRPGAGVRRALRRHRRWPTCARFSGPSWPKLPRLRRAAAPLLPRAELAIRHATRQIPAPAVRANHTTVSDTTGRMLIRMPTGLAGALPGVSWVSLTAAGGGRAGRGGRVSPAARCGALPHPSGGNRRKRPAGWYALAVKYAILTHCNRARAGERYPMRFAKRTIRGWA